MLISTQIGADARCPELAGPFVTRYAPNSAFFSDSDLDRCHTAARNTDQLRAPDIQTARRRQPALLRQHHWPAAVSTSLDLYDAPAAHSITRQCAAGQSYPGVRHVKVTRSRHNDQAAFLLFHPARAGAEQFREHVRPYRVTTGPSIRISGARTPPDGAHAPRLPDLDEPAEHHANATLGPHALNWGGNLAQSKPFVKHSPS